jgi:hypothetical protein
MNQPRHRNRLLVLLAFATLILATAPVYAVSSTGRVEIMGQVPDVIFQPGVPAKKTITYRMKSLALGRAVNNGIYARSIVSGVSVEDSYVRMGTVVPPFTMAAVGPAVAQGYSEMSGSATFKVWKPLAPL